MGVGSGWEVLGLPARSIVYTGPLNRVGMARSGTYVNAGVRQWRTEIHLPRGAIAFKLTDAQVDKNVFAELIESVAEADEILKDNRTSSREDHASPKRVREIQLATAASMKFARTSVWTFPLCATHAFPAPQVEPGNS